MSTSLAPSQPDFYINKWITFSACAICQLSAGLCYTFGIISADLKELFGWSQGHLTGFGTALNLGAFAAFIPGILYNLLKQHRHGPRLCLVFAAAECSAGMGLVWAATTRRLELSYPALLAAAFLFTNSNATIDVVSVSCNVANWPNDRGSAVGVMKAAVGLSGSVYGVFFAALGLTMEGYMLLCLAAPAACCLLAAPLVNHVPWIQRCELMPHGLLTSASRFFMSYQVLLLVALFTTFASVVLGHDGSATARGLVAAALAVLIASLFLVAVYSGGIASRPAHIHVLPALAAAPPETRRPRESVLSHAVSVRDLLATLRRDSMPNIALHTGRTTYEIDAFESSELDAIAEDFAATAAADGRDGVAGGGSASEPLLAALPGAGAGAASEALTECRSETSIASELYHEQPASDVTPLQVFASPDFHLLVFCCFGTMGAALAVLDNLPQLLLALAPPPGAGGGGGGARRLDHALVVCFSVSNTLGRIAAGYISELALHTRGTPRPFFCAVLAAATAAWTAAAAAAAALAGTPVAPLLLIPVTIAAGSTFGGYWTLMATITSELFGLRNFSSNYAAVQLAPILATAICPTLLVGRLYDAEARRQNPGIGGGNVPCEGAACFLPAFAILFGIALLQTLAAVALWLRTAWVYAREAAHLKELDENVMEEGTSVCTSVDGDVSGYEHVSGGHHSHTHVSHYAP